MKLEYVRLPSKDEDEHYIVYNEDKEMHVTVEHGCEKTLQNILEEYLQVQVELAPKYSEK